MNRNDRRRRDLFPLGESDATLNEERRAHWGGAGNYISTGARAVASAGRSYTSSNPFSGAHISYGSSSGARGVYSAGRSYVSHGNPFSSGGGGGSSAAAAQAAQQAAAQQRAQAVAVQLQRNGVQLANDLSTLRSQASSGQQAAQAILSSIGLQHLGSQGVAQASVPALQSLKKPTAVPQAPLSQSSAAKAVAQAAPHIGNPLGPVPKSLASVGAAAGQHAAPLVYQASLSPAKQQLLAQVTTQATAHDALGAAAINARNQSLSAYNAQTAAHSAQGQAVANQLTQDNLRVGQSLIHPGADTNQGLWGPLNMKRYQPGGKTPSTLAPATASPVTALTNLFGGSSKPNFTAIGAAAGQAVGAVPKPKPGLSTSGTISAAPRPSPSPQMAAVRHSALTALNTAATNQVAANQALPAMTGHLGPNIGRTTAHPGRSGLYSPGQIQALANRPVTPGDIASAQRNAALAIATAHGLKASPNVLKALIVNIQGAPGFVIGNRAQIASRAAAFVNTAKHFDGKGLGTVELKNAVWKAAPQAIAAHVGPKALANSKAFSLPRLFALAQHVTGVKLGNPGNVGTGQGPAGVPSSVKDIFVSAGKKYGIPPAVLWSIYGVESNFGKNPSTSTAGAVGPMQFLPSTWAKYGVAVGHGGPPNIHDLRDAVHGAANYIAASGGKTDIRKGIFAYNHAGWYVDKVMAGTSAWNNGKGATGTYTPGTAGSSGAPSSAGSGAGVSSSSSASSSTRGAGTSGATSAGTTAAASVLASNVNSNLARYGVDLSNHLDTLKNQTLSAHAQADQIIQDLVANMRSGKHTGAPSVSAPRKPSLPRLPHLARR